jgi:hypothetical protein
MIKDRHSHGCNMCGKWHHTSLHRNKDFSQEHNNRSQDLSQQQNNVQATYHSFKESPIACVLLAMAQVKIKIVKEKSTFVEHCWTVDCSLTS